MNFRQRTLFVLSATAVLGIAGTALGGLDNGQQVQISDNGVVTGTLRAVNDSPDSTQVIACSVTTYANSSTENALCYARDAEGQFAYCVTSNPDHIRGIRSIDESAHLQFIIGSDGTCSSVDVWQSSSSL